VEYGDGIWYVYAANLGVDRDEGLNLGTNDYSKMIMTEVNPSEEDRFVKQVGSLVFALLTSRPALTWLRRQSPGV